jgi:hypothetical protein
MKAILFITFLIFMFLYPELFLGLIILYMVLFLIVLFFFEVKNRLGK